MRLLRKFVLHWAVFEVLLMIVVRLLPLPLSPASADRVLIWMPFALSSYVVLWSILPLAPILDRPKIEPLYTPDLE